MGATQVIGANGKPYGALGWLVPILRDENNQCFLLGTAPEEGFPDEELDVWARDRLTKFSEFTLVSELMRQPAPGARPGDAQELLSSDIYAFYYSTEKAEQLELGIESVLSDFQTQEVSDPSNTAFHFLLLGRDALRGVLSRLFDLLEQRLISWLKDVLETGIHDSSRRVVADDYARVLNEIAYDPRTGSKAIEMRAMTISLGPERDQLGRWIAAAAQTWDLPTVPEYWYERQRDLMHGILAEWRIEKEREETEKQLEAFASNVQEKLHEILFSLSQQPLLLPGPSGSAELKFSNKRMAEPQLDLLDPRPNILGTQTIN